MFILCVHGKTSDIHPNTSSTTRDIRLIIKDQLSLQTSRLLANQELRAYNEKCGDCREAANIGGPAADVGDYKLGWKLKVTQVGILFVTTLEALFTRCTTPIWTRISSPEKQLPLEGFNWLSLWPASASVAVLWISMQTISTLRKHGFFNRDPFHL